MSDLPEAPKGLAELVQEGAGNVVRSLGSSLGGGLEKAGQVLTTPEGADLTALLPAADLPELPAEGPLGALALRLDREADLFRGVALRELARIGWMERIAQTMVVGAAVCEIAVAACTVALAVFGGPVEGRLALLFMASAAVGIAGVGAAWSASRMRAAHTRLADDALARARSLEERLFRVGLAMEWRAAGPTLYQEALARLERDVSPVPAGFAVPLGER